MKNKKQSKKLIVIFLALISSTCFQLPVFADDGSLIMGVFPRRPAQTTIQAFTPLAEYLSEKLKREVKLVTTYDFTSFWQDIEKKKYDIVHYNQYQYIQSHKEFGYQVIVMNEEFNKTTISSVLISKNPNITSLKDIAGKTIAFGGGPKAMVSYILPIYTLRNAGITNFQFKSIFAINPPNAMMSVYFDRADVAGVGNKVVEMSDVKNNISAAKLKIISQSEEISQLPWAVKNNMPKELKSTIQELFINLKNDDKNKIILSTSNVTNFVIAKDSDYNRTREIVFEVTGVQY